MTVVAGLLMAGLLVAQGADITPAVIGDSYASGTGAGEYSDELCMRSDRSAAGHAAEFFDTDSINVACNGAWVDDLTEPRVIARNRTDIDLEGNAVDLAAFHRVLLECGRGMAGASASLEFEENGEAIGVICTLTLDPQIEATEEASDIFLSIGGNDIGFVPVAGACLIQEDEDLCRESVEAAEQALGPALVSQREAVMALQGERPNARIHLVPYPRILDEDSARMIGSYDVGADVTALQEEWEGELRAMAEDLDISYVETVTPIWEGHGIGAADSWIHMTGNIGELLHPTEEGWRATGTALISHLGMTLLP